MNNLFWDLHVTMQIPLDIVMDELDDHSKKLKWRSKP
jgi:hypothetical protein